MISEYDLCMALPKDIPTLEASSMKNYTRVDDVFCSPDIFDCFIECDTYPHWCPQKTDHMPIISKLDIEPLESTQIVKYNVRAMDWKEFRKALETRLEVVQLREEITTEEMLLDQIAKLDLAIKMSIKEVVPLSKPSPYTKRWWNKDLTIMKKKERLARKSYKRRAEDENPIHEEFRQARNLYSEAIRKAKDNHWVGWLEMLDKGGIWAANRLTSGAGTDGGRNRIPTLLVKDPITKRITKEARTKGTTTLPSVLSQKNSTACQDRKLPHHAGKMALYTHN